MASRLAQPKRASRRLGIANVFVRVKGDVSRLTKKQASSLLKTIAQVLGYRVLGQLEHAFKPHGVTTVLLLSESHLSIHTWPEHQEAVVEMVTCKTFTQRDQQRLLAAVKRYLPKARFRVILNT